MKVYKSFEEIDQELKRLDLQRQIAVEHLKLTGNQVKEDLSPLNWINTLLNVFYKYGITILIKRLFKKL